LSRPSASALIAKEGGNILAIQARRIEEKADKIEACSEIARFDAAHMISLIIATADIPHT
jgi:hypothetical protein